MSIILYFDHKISLNSVCDIYLQLTDQAIKNPETNIRLAWAAVTLGNRLLVGLCRCFEATCTCATQKTGEILSSLKNSQAQIYCRERARNRDQATVIKQFLIGSTCFARQKACRLHPTLIEGELGIITAHCTTHGDLMAKVNFKTHGILEIPSEIAFIHPLEARKNWTMTGPQFELGDKITTFEGQAIFRVVHGFVTQPEGKSLVLIWFNETDRYQQLRPDQIQPDNTALPTAPPTIPQPGNHNTGQKCLSGCTLLANPLGGIPMREVRPDTLHINAKGRKVRVTNVYFSMESSVMAQISEHCHASTTHPMLDTKGAGQMQLNRGIPAKTIVAAVEWYTRRREDTYRNSPMDAPLYQPFGPQVSQYLHSSSPQNLRKSGDMWGFSTEDNQPVRSFDDPHCLICPIGHIGWAQVDIAKAVLSCWGRARHLPEPRPDLVEFQEQTKAIHAFLSSPEAVKSLEKRHLAIHNQHSIAPFKLGKNKHLIEFTNGHVHLDWERGRWVPRDWNSMETRHPSWIQPEEDLLSALIRPPSRPEPEAPEPEPVNGEGITGTDHGKTGMATPQHSNHGRVLNKDGMEDSLPTQVALDKHAMEDGH